MGGMRWNGQRVVPVGKVLCAMMAWGCLPLQAGIVAKVDGGNVRVEIDGKLFTEYRSEARVPCLYPLMSPDGTHLTRRFPFEKGVAGEQSDHPHHMGFWFTHGSVNGADFWHGKDGSRVVSKGLFQEPEVRKGDDGEEVLSFGVDLEWLKGDGTSVLSEKRHFAIRQAGNARVIDLVCELQARGGDVVFGSTKEGSFAIRLAPTLRLKGEVAEGRILNSEGLEDSAVWGRRAKWVAYHGPDSNGTKTVVALLDHSENLRHPTWWHARDYGLLAANPFGVEDFKDKSFGGDGSFTLEAGGSLRQRYRLILHQGDLESAAIEASWQDFSHGCSKD